MKKNKEDKDRVREEVQLKPLEVVVRNDHFEDAVRKFKSIFQKEKVVAKFKEKQSYEKPSEKKRRKRREAEERKFQIEMREELIKSGEWAKRQQKKELKKQSRLKKTDKNG